MGCEWIQCTAPDLCNYLTIGEKLMTYQTTASRFDYHFLLLASIEVCSDNVESNSLVCIKGPNNSHILTSIVILGAGHINVICEVYSSDIPQPGKALGVEKSSVRFNKDMFSEDNVRASQNKCCWALKHMQLCNWWRPSRSKRFALSTCTQLCFNAQQHLFWIYERSKNEFVF